VLTYKQKGGMESQKEISKELADKIRENAKNGIFEISKSTYSRYLEREIKATGQTYNGTHGIRHAYAQNLIRKGYSKQQVSKEMGHTREQITNTYLR
jgi:integrase